MITDALRVLEHTPHENRAAGADVERGCGIDQAFLGGNGERGGGRDAILAGDGIGIGVGIDMDDAEVVMDPAPCAQLWQRDEAVSSHRQGRHTLAGNPPHRFLHDLEGRFGSAGRHQGIAAVDDTEFAQRVGVIEGRMIGTHKSGLLTNGCRSQTGSDACRMNATVKGHADDRQTTAVESPGDRGIHEAGRGTVDPGIEDRRRHGRSFPL